DVALTNNTAATNGGAVAVSSFNSQGQLNVNGGLFHNNSADLFGGGLYVDGVTAVINGATFTNNRANFGGGLCVQDGNETHLAGAQIKRATFSGNSVPGQGGAAFADLGTIVFLTDTT